MAEVDSYQGDSSSRYRVVASNAMPEERIMAAYDRRSAAIPASRYSSFVLQTFRACSSVSGRHSSCLLHIGSIP